MPSTPSSRFSSRLRRSSSACRVSAASLCSTESMPTRSQARRLPLMYEALAGIVADQHHGETRRAAARRRAGRDLARHALAQLLRKREAVDDDGLDAAALADDIAAHPD